MIIVQRAQAETDDGPKSRVFLVHGRDRAARQGIMDLLAAFGLRVITWDEASTRPVRSRGLVRPIRGMSC